MRLYYIILSYDVVFDVAKLSDNKVEIMNVGIVFVR